ncbi:uncharacterized protein LOC124537054 [Vanessa cardui]|uniref:uncharacterized protein LOC124537054 n=1 Tax=Vanessa cardui TaxID=171605 RepID=UPI001F143BA7|nr:uncharacterized protein LOC124537054 [Vanessa cardui]
MDPDDCECEQKEKNSDMSQDEELLGWISPILMDHNKKNYEHVFMEEDVKEKENITLDRPIKRGREEEDNEWTKVEKKIRKQGQIRTEIFISSREKLPKQFAIAKLFTSLNFIEIIKIKYINPYRIKLEVPNDDYASKVISCPDFEKKGWRVYRESEVNVTHGIIRNVDLELTDSQVLDAIKCPNNIQILALKRLKRRNEDGQWIPSEVARGAVHFPGHTMLKMLEIRAS